MKKILLLTLLLLTGCNTLDISNTPTKKVETFLNNYQILTQDVLNDLDNVIEEQYNFSEEIKQEYKELIKKQYKNMQYEIKEEKIDGNTAEVTAEIIVKDYTKIINETELYKQNNIEQFYENDIYSENKYRKYLLEQLKDTKDKITYTIKLNLTKENNKWNLDELDEETEDKILGIYKY